MRKFPIEVINKNVKIALDEDTGTGDLTALLIPEHNRSTAKVVSRETAVLCGTQWFERCFKTLSPETEIQWFARDGDTVTEQQTLCTITGESRTLLTAERTALNFLQTLSAVATQTRAYVDAVASTRAVIVDTRKTLPGLRMAQKYAVHCGGGMNHRTGLYDGILIKENHITAAGGIAQALEQARTIAPENVFIQIEVESVTELETALDAGAVMVLLDNFTIDQIHKAVTVAKDFGKKSQLEIILEASGNINLNTVHRIAETGVDRISIGGLTKNIRAVDLSMQLV